MAVWDEVDDRVLRWLLDRDADPEWGGRTDNLLFRPAPEPQATFENDLDARQVDEALSRLHGHGLIAGVRGATTHYEYWSQLRLTAQGLILLGEWPDLDRVASAQGLTVLLAELADEASEEDDKKALRQTAGAIGRLGEGIVSSTVASVGKELASK
jgi:hypothetical protein